MLGAQVDDIAVLTVQCNAQQLFLAMTTAGKNLTALSVNGFKMTSVHCP
jgi:hypothetical protein